MSPDKDKPKILENAKLHKRIGYVWQSFEVYKRHAALLLSVMLLAALTEGFGLALAVPVLEMILKDGTPDSPFVRPLKPVLMHFPPQYAALAGGLVVFLFVVINNCVVTFRAAFAAYFVNAIQNMHRRKIMSLYLMADFRYILAHKQGVLIDNLINRTSNASKFIYNLIELTSHLVITAAMTILMLALSWKLTLGLAILFGVPIFLTKNWIKRYSDRYGRKSIKYSQNMSAVAAETFGCMRHIKTLSYESRQLSRFMKLTLEKAKLHTRFVTATEMPNVAGSILNSSLMIGLILIMTFYQTLDKALLLSTMIIFMIVSQRLLTSVTVITRLRMQALMTYPGFELVQSIIHAAVRQENLEYGQTFPGLQSDIELKDVGFEYESTQPILEHIDLTIKRGETTAIIGPSGCGKSTLADLLLRMYDPTEGRISVNGKDVSEYSLSSWRKTLAFVPQETQLFNTSIRENILAGNPDASEQEVIRAAQQAHAHEFIDELEEGYDTTVGDRGSKLSGGQRQRLGIARAIIRDAQIYILDEPTSSLDDEAREMILQSIQQLQHDNKTIILITHQREVAKHADKIYDFNYNAQAACETAI